MEIRKVQRIGNSWGFIIPKGYMRFMGLKPKDLVIIRLTPKKIIIEPYKEEEKIYGKGNDNMGTIHTHG